MRISGLLSGRPPTLSLSRRCTILGRTQAETCLLRQQLSGYNVAQEHLQTRLRGHWQRVKLNLAGIGSKIVRKKKRERLGRDRDQVPAGRHSR